MKIKKLILYITTFLLLSISGYSQCAFFTIEMHDTYGDGWNGSYIDVVNATGTSFGHATIANGSNETMTININNPGSEISFIWHSGSFVSETSFIIYNEYGEEIYTGSGNQMSNNNTFFTYSCIPCQDFSFTVNDIVQGDTTMIDLCSIGSSLIAVGSYPNNGTNYQQSDANLTWSWDIAHEGNHIAQNGQGLSTFNPTFPGGGGYIVNISATDINGCIFNHTPIRLRVALDVIWNGTGPDPACMGEPFTLSMGQTDPNTGTANTDLTYTQTTWTYTEPEILFETHCFTDDMQYEPQTAEFTYTTFSPTCVINSVNDIESIVIYIEHSYIGDLTMYISCPNGSTITLIDYNNNGCGMAYFGEPIDDACGLCDSNCEINPVTGLPINGGTVFPYTWAPNGTQTLNQLCNNVAGGQTVPNATALLPEGGFNAFIGCPLNGTWTIGLIDNLGLDDGYVNQFEIHFNEALVEACQSDNNTWEIIPTYHDEIWTGNNIISGTGGVVQASSEVSGNIPYTFTVYDDFNCPHDTVVFVTIKPEDDPTCCIEPTPYAGNDTTVCGSLFAFDPTPSNGTQRQWTTITKPEGAPDPVITNANAVNASVNVGTAYGTYTFEFREIYHSQSCNNADTVTVTFLEIPTSTFNTTPISCYGETTTITYTGNMTNVNTANYTWNFADGEVTNISGFPYGPFMVSWEEAGAHTITLSVLRDACLSTQTNVNVLTPTQLTQQVSTTDITCFGLNNGIATSTAQGGTPPYTYSWESGTAIQPNLAPGIYTLTLTDANGCQAQQSFAITEPPELRITDTTYTHLLCFNSNDGTIGINVTGGTNPLSYNWNDGHTGELSRASLNAGYYTITITDALGCSVTESFTITQPEQLLAIISPNLVICEYQEAVIQIQAIGGVPNYRYYWHITPDNPVYTEGGATIIATPHETTVYRCRIEDAHNCSSNEVITQVTISPDIIIDNITVKDNTCNNSCDGEAILGVTGGIPPLQYSWASPNHHLHNACAGLYSVTISDAVGCNETTTFIIEEPTALTFTTYSQAVNCYGDENGIASITVSGGTPPYEYLWPDGQTTPSITTKAGSYEVTVVDANNCRITTIIDIETPSQMLTLDMSNKTICQGSYTTLITQTTGGTQYYDYHWSDGNGNEYFDNAWDVSPIENTTYYLTVTDANGCTNSPEPVTISVYQPVKINSIYSNRELICPGQEVEIRVNVTGGNGGPYLMRYSLNSDGTADTIVGSPFVIYPTESNLYYVFVEDMCGNEAVKDSIYIAVRPNPNRGFKADVINGCSPLTVNFTDENFESFEAYSWRFGDNAYSYERFATYTYNDAGTYSVDFEITDTLGCNYLYSAKNLITVYPNPHSLFTMSNETINSERTLIEFQSHSEDAIHYYWSFGDGDSSINVNPSHFFNINALEYNTCLIVENNYNCRDTSCRTITVDGILTIYFPTSFTPNDDGKNDCFKPCGYGINPAGYSLKIFDRYGEVIFKTNTFIETPENGSCSECTEGAWNGKRNNKDKVLPVGTYYWQCVFKDKFDNQYTKEGAVTLLR